MRCLLLLFALVAPSIVHADAIDPPPACPPGARGATSHAGQWCTPAPCTADTECAGGACRAWRVCTRAAMVHPGGLDGMDRPPSRMDLVVGTCEPTRGCTGTEEPPPSVVGTFEPDPPSCIEARFCVPATLPTLPARGTSLPAAEASSPMSPPPPTSARGCACGIAGSRSALGPIAIALGVAVVVARRRR